MFGPQADRTASPVHSHKAVGDGLLHLEFETRIGILKKKRSICSLHCVCVPCAFLGTFQALKDAERRTKELETERAALLRGVAKRDEALQLMKRELERSAAMLSVAADTREVRKRGCLWGCVTESMGL